MNIKSRCRSSQADSAPPKKVASVEGITEYRLDNGLRLLLFPDASQPSVTVNMTVFVGSRHEGYGESGMAHLLEHMVFKGTPTHANIPRLLQERGARFNGTTSVDRTNYFETLTAGDENLEFAIRLEADRLVNSHVEGQDLLSEMTVVRNEFERGENSPSSVLNKRIMAAAYEWHNYGKSTIGNRSDIERVPIEKLRAFYRKYYQPDNALVVIAGRFDEAKALGYVRKYFGTIPRPQRALDATYTDEPAQDGERQVVLRRVGEVGLVGLAYHIPAGSHAEFPALEVLANILTTQPSGRLYQALVEAKKATRAFAYARSTHDPGVLFVQAEAEGQDEQSLEAVRDAMIEIVEGIGRQGVSSEEVDRARLQILKRREQAAVRTSLLAVSLSGWAAQGDWRLYFLHRDRIEKVTPDDVRQAAARYLRQNNRTVGFYIPTSEAERISVPRPPDVAALVENYRGRESIAAGEVFDPTPANLEARIERQTLGRGVKVALLPKRTRGREVVVNLTLRYGNDRNLRGQVAAAGFLAPLMMRGTRNLTRQQLIDELDRLQASLGAARGGGRRGGRANGTAGEIEFSIQAKRDKLPAVLDLLRQVLREPLLPAAEFEILKRARLASLERQRTEPSALGPRKLSRLLAPYPPEDVRYLPTIEEEIAGVQDVTVEQVRALYDQYLGAAAGEIAIAGDFDTYECLKVLRDALEYWDAERACARIERPLSRLADGGPHDVVTPDKANATYAAGLLLKLDDRDPDYPALLMANYILGGGSLASRLGDRIRQREGLSYSVGSGFAALALDPRASFSVRAICNPENMPRVEQAVREELDRMRQDGVSDEELARAREGYLQQLKVSRTSDATLAGMLGRLLHEGRTMMFYADLEQSIEALTAKQVSDAFRRRIDPKNLVIVRAGDLKEEG